MLFDEIDSVGSVSGGSDGHPRPPSYYYLDLRLTTSQQKMNVIATPASAALCEAMARKTPSPYVVITLYDALDQVIAFRRVSHAQHHCSGRRDPIHR